MTFEEFGRIVDRRLGIIADVLGKKGRHYNRGAERFHNFKRGGEIAGVSPERALWGYLTKHLISVLDIIDGQVPLTQELIDEKMGDCINYFFLLEGLFTERLQVESQNRAVTMQSEIGTGDGG